MNEERKKILDMVATGKISPEQGAALLGLVSTPDETEAAPAEQSGLLGVPEAEGTAKQTPADSSGPAPSGSASPPTGSTGSRFGPLWLYPLGVGTGLLLVGGTIVSAT